VELITKDRTEKQVQWQELLMGDEGIWLMGFMYIHEIKQ
jgi:hypothetical protein